jgi:hypothetical protein
MACFAATDIKAIKTNEQFQETAHIDQLQQIKINTVPRTTYTPTNLRTQYNMSFQGRNTTDGSMTVWSNTFTDYDTYINDSRLVGNEYFIYDNTGKSFKTGEHTDLTPIQNEINSMNTRMNNYGRDITQLNDRVSDLQEEVYSGLATVTALTSLHPNPRSTAPVELSLGTGIFRDQCAGAAGLFIHPKDNFMLQGAAAFGNNNDWAGYVGVTVGLKWPKFRR